MLNFNASKHLFIKIVSLLMSAITVLLPLVSEGLSSVSESSSAVIADSLLHPKTQNGVDVIANALLRQIFYGDGSREDIRKTLDSIPMLDDVREVAVSSEMQQKLSVLNASADKQDDSQNVFEFIIQEFRLGVNNFRVCFSPTQYDEIFEFRGLYYYDDGTERTISTSVYYNRETGYIYGGDSKGMFGLGYDYSVEDFMLYASDNPWMRQFGYNRLFDILAPVLLMNFETIRVNFSYDSRKWMIQLWKGYYTAARGAEIGLYYMDENDLVGFYTSAGDDDRIDMAFTLSDESGTLLSRGRQKHWWISGFYLSPYELPDFMTLEGTLGFPDEEMRDAFVKALENLFTLYDLSYTVDGLDVSFRWN